MKNQHLKYSFITLVILFLLPIVGLSQPQKSYTSAEIQLLLKKLNTAGTVLYVAAHPDDENTRLLSYLANERCVRTAYVSLTRGDGGQNLIGQDIGPLLGLIRSYELMAARNIDGAEQFFTRAYDFGYSKSPEETFDIWGRDEVLDDLVYIIRYFRPDLIITRFSAHATRGHGHHTASAILAEDAFKAASNPTDFSHQLKNLSVWSPHALLYNNASRFWNPDADMSDNIEINVGKYNPLLGRSYGEIAGLSRSMHKSQGFGSRNHKGDILEYFKPILGYTPEEDIFEGLDLSLNRIKGGEKLAVLSAKALKNFDPSDPSQILPDLMAAYESLDEIKDAYWQNVKRKELETLIIACSGIWLEANAASPTITPGEKLIVNYFMVNRSASDVKINSVQLNQNYTVVDEQLLNNKPIEIKDSIILDKNMGHTGPYWLKSEPVDGLFSISDQNQLQKPVDFGHFDVNFKLQIGGKYIEIVRPILFKWVDPVQGEQFRFLEVIPEVTLHWTDKVLVFSGNSSKKINITVKAGKDIVEGEVRLKSDFDFTIHPSKHYFSLSRKDEEQVFEFEIQPGMERGLSHIKAEALIGDKVLDRSMIQLEYDHIPIQTIFPEAHVKVANLDIKYTPSRLGYIPGAGDEVAPALRQIGYRVDELTAEGIDKNNLNQYKAILTGIRAFNTNDRLFAQMNRLNQYVENGGVLIVQYVTNSWAGPLKGPISPYDMKINRTRVTDEQAPVKFLVPDHMVLNEPNKITQQDFEGWIQERGLYFAEEWSKEFVTPLEMSDPGEEGHAGSLLIAHYGKGYYVYTGLSFFRQMPNGTPGAYRLLTNLIELGNVQP